jgi:SAM-dependent methyltransferase
MTATTKITTTSELFDAADEKLLDLINFLLEQRVTSYSVVDNIPTGNAYQSVQLRGQISSGFREQRSEIFAGIPLRGKRVFDIGCNLGENCRILRQGGAELVDGLEYEKLFVRIGELINVYNGLTRINLRQGDASNPGEYVHDYDHVFAFSVFPYIKDRLEDIARITKEIFFMETHQLNDRWVERYVVQAMKHFRYMGVVCATDWGKELDQMQRRLLLAFSNEPKAIPTYISNRANESKSTPNAIQVDMDKSNWHFLSRFFQFIEPKKNLAHAITKATEWVVANDFTSCVDQLDVSGVEYWCRFLVGYSEYVGAGNRVAHNNHFLVYLANGLEKGFGDQALREKQLDVVIARRFSDLADVSAHPSGGACLDPIVLYNCTTNEELGKSSVSQSEGTTFYCLALDGYHRVFSTKVVGARFISAVKFWYSHHPVANTVYQKTDIRDLLRDVVP